MDQEYLDKMQKAARELKAELAPRQRPGKVDKVQIISVVGNRLELKANTPDTLEAANRFFGHLGCPAMVVAFTMTIPQPQEYPQMDINIEICEIPAPNESVQFVAVAKQSGAHRADLSFKAYADRGGKTMIAQGSSWLDLENPYLPEPLQQQQPNQ
ncbi:unnamed protein product [Caenorhabditis nigoni]